METRKVLIWNTKGQTRKVVETSATTFGKLMADAGMSIDFSSYRIVEGNSMITFDNTEAVLPETVKTAEGIVTKDLTIVISPSKKINSGGLSVVRDTLYTEVRGFVEQYGEYASAYFKGYTNLSNADIQEKLNAFKAPVNQTGSSSPSVIPTVNVVLTIKVENSGAIITSEAAKEVTDFTMSSEELTEKYRNI